MKKSILALTALLVSSPLYASPVATFDVESVPTVNVESVPTVNVESVILDDTLETSSLPEDTQIELATIKSMLEVIRSQSVDTYSTRIYNSKMVITQAEYNTLYNQRLASHRNGTKPLPVRYLPTNYDNNMTVASSNSLDKTVMYEIVTGYPIFYRIDRYNRPNSYAELNSIPTTNSDKLDTAKPGLTPKIGTLYLN